MYLQCEEELWDASLCTQPGGDTSTAAQCADVPVVVIFTEPTSATQQLWLRTTRVRVRHVAFHVDDNASAALLHDPSTLVGWLVPDTSMSARNKSPGLVAGGVMLHTMNNAPTN